MSNLPEDLKVCNCAGPCKRMLISQSERERVQASPAGSPMRGFEFVYRWIKQRPYCESCVAIVETT